jgi:hypothetical protein
MRRGGVSGDENEDEEDKEEEEEEEEQERWQVAGCRLQVAGRAQVYVQ